MSTLPSTIVRKSLKAPIRIIYSRDDIAATRRLARTLEAIGVTLVDHLVLAGTRSASLRDAGLL